MSKITITRKARMFDVVDGKLVRRDKIIPAQSRTRINCGHCSKGHLVSEGQVINCRKNSINAF